MEYIFHKNIKVFWNHKHKLGGGGAVPTLYPADSFGAVSDSSGKVILVNATLFADFFDIVDNLLSVKLDAPAPCRLDAPDLDLICYASADCLHQHLQVIWST